MLKQLYIKNFTLIDELNIQMHPGFSVITGETGAGKSIILGAIGLLLGNRADSKSIKAGRDRCVIEAHFDLSKYDMQQFFTDNDIDEDLSDTIIRRELTAAGKSRAFINDTPVSLTKMRELGEQLVDIHSQHQNLLLQKEDFQLNVVDIIAQDEKQRKNYETAYNQYKQANQKLNALKAEIEKNRENEDFLRFQFKELDEAQLQNGEQEELEQEYEMLSHSEDIKTALYQADNHLSGDDGNIIERLKQASEQLANIKDVYPEVTELLERIDSSYIELKDIAQEVNGLTDHVEFDPARLETINERLDKLNSLQQKFHVRDLGELIETYHQLKEQLSHIDHSDEDVEALEQEVTQLLEKAQKQADKYQKRMNELAPMVKNMEKLAADFSADPEQTLPEAAVMESAKSYREKKAKPLVKKIVQVMRSVYSAYLDISNKFTKLQAAYNRERSGNERLTNRLEEVLEENRELRIVVEDFGRIKAVVGSEQVNAVIDRVKQQEQIEAEQKRAARRKHNREAR